MLHPALNTPVLTKLGCSLPIVAAGMGGVSRHELVAAVCNAGGFASLGMVREPVALIRREIAALRALSDKPFAVNLIPAATSADLLKEQVAACLELKVPAISLFWDVDAPLIAQLKDAGVLVIQQIGTPQQAEQALKAGVDILIAQGLEAGGHVWGQTTLLALLPEVVKLAGGVPVLACGGIASGEGLVAALALGAQGVVCGSAFLATDESYAHRMHKEALVAGDPNSTVLTTQFFRNWPMAAPVRVLPNAVTRGEFAALEVLRSTPVIGEQDGGPIYLFSSDSPLRDGSGQLEHMPIYAGQSCGLIEDIVPAAVRLKRLLDQAQQCLERLAG